MPKRLPYSKQQNSSEGQGIEVERIRYVKGYDLDYGTDYKEVCERDKLYEKAGDIMNGMMSTLQKKTEHYNNAVMKRPFLGLFWDLQRRWGRIFLDFKEPYVRKLDIILGRDGNSEFDISNPKDRQIIMNERFKDRVESIRETFTDMAIYCIIGIIFFESTLERAMEKVAELEKDQFQDVK